MHYCVRFKKLKRGDRLWVLAPSGALSRRGDRKDFLRGVQILLGRYKVEVRKSVYAISGFFAGSDILRYRELNRAINSDSCQGIFTVRGGHGVTRILPNIDWKGWRRSRKPLVGFSDITALNLALLSKGLGFSIHGPSVSSIYGQPAGFLNCLWRLMEDESVDFIPPPVGLKSMVRGDAIGAIIGGNMTMIQSLIGTRFLPEIESCILFLEEVNEQPYRIDRLFTHMRNSGLLSRISGVVLGSFKNCSSRGHKVGTAGLMDVFYDNLVPLGIPVAYGYPGGHGKRNWPFIEGAIVRLMCSRSGGEAVIKSVK